MANKSFLKLRRLSSLSKRSSIISLVSFLVVSSLVILFQNCGGGGGAEGGFNNSKYGSYGSIGSNGGASGYGTGSGSGSSGGSGSSTDPFGSSNGSSSGSGGTSNGGFPGSSSGSGSAGSSSGGFGSSGGSSGSFSVKRSPENQTIMMTDTQNIGFDLGVNPKLANGSGSASFVIEVQSPTGGLVAYTWYKAGVALTPQTMGQNMFLSTVQGDQTNSLTSVLTVSVQDYRQAGSFSVKAVDSAGRTINLSASLIVQEASVGCAAGTYWIANNDPFLIAANANYLSNRFVANNGNWFLHNKYVGGANAAQLVSTKNNQFQRKAFSFPTGQYNNLVNMSCEEFVPMANPDTHAIGGQDCPTNGGFNPGTDTPYDCHVNGPAFPSGHWGVKSTKPNLGTLVNGVYQTNNIIWQCQNNKWKLVANNCQWFSAAQLCNNGAGIQAYCAPPDNGN